MIKKLTTFSIIVLSFLVFNFQVGAQEKGYKCSSNQCLSCNIGESDCKPGVCTAFICDNNDSIAPVTPYITNLNELSFPIDGTSLRVRGYGEPNARVIIFINDKEVNQGNIKTDGTFDISFNPALTQNGEYNLHIIVRDQANNESKKSAVVKIKVDNSKPEIKFTDLPDLTSFSNILLNGKTSPGATINIYKAQRILGTSGADKDGNFNIIASLVEGDNKINVEVVDTKGSRGSTDINIKYNPNDSKKLELVSSSGKFVKLNLPEDIIAVEVLRDGILVSIVNKGPENPMEIDLSSIVTVQYEKLEFIGVDKAGNKTEPLPYTVSNNPLILIIPLIFIIGCSFTLYILVKKGKVKFDLSPTIKPKESKKVIGEDKSKETVVSPRKLSKEF